MVELNKGGDMYNKPLMKCGHSANATHKGKPCCVICFGFSSDALEIDESPPSLDGRKAICVYCSKGRDSSSNLPFFEYDKKKNHDSYYCGCRGWD